MRPSLRLLRLWLPVIVCGIGVLLLLTRRDLLGWEGFSLFVGAGLSIWLLNFLYRLSVSGDRDRDDEDRAREYFDRHGRWPEEDGPPAR